MVLTRSGAEIVADEHDDGVVCKLHRPGTDPRALAARLRVAAASDCFLDPLTLVPDRVGTRWMTRWPRVETVVPQPHDLPWAEAGRLLARLHTERFAARNPANGWPQRMRRAVDAARHHDVVRCAAAALPDAAWRPGSPDRPSTLVHGDWHLGQLGRRTAQSPWLLIDVDDLGVGDPAWDLARPAGFWAAGLIPDSDWATFVGAYCDAGGPADPSALEPFARAAVVQAAAGGVAHGDDDETQAALIDACARMR